LVRIKFLSQYGNWSLTAISLEARAKPMFWLHYGSCFSLHEKFGALIWVHLACWLVLRK
jgi:hypothetical protein